MQVLWCLYTSLCRSHLFGDESEVNTEVKFKSLRLGLLLSKPRLHVYPDWNYFLLSKLITSVMEALSFTLSQVSLRCYNDSQVALVMIRETNKDWRLLVNNRVCEFRRRVHPDCWCCCPGSSNPADLLSRGLTSFECQLWRCGPEWIQAGFELSFHGKVQSMPRECTLELKTTQSHSLVSTEPNKL